MPRLVKQVGKGSWEYTLGWRNLPDHTGDVVNPRIELPASWTWIDSPPPAQFSLDREMTGSWRLASGD